jgi:hypothetical protein
MKKKKLLTISALTLSLALVGNAAMAAPSSNPPTGNVNASFNSTSYPNNASPNIIIDAVTGIYSTVQTTLAQLTVTGASKFGNLNITATGDLSSQSGDTVKVKDGLNVQPHSDSGNSNVQLVIKGTPKPNSLLTMPVIETYDSSGASIPTWLRNGLSVGSQAGNYAGRLFIDAATGDIVNEAMQQVGNAWSGVPVKINDAEGLQVGNDPTRVLINPDGRVWGLSAIFGSGAGFNGWGGGVVKLGKLSIDSQGTLANTETGAGGVYGLNYSDWPVTIDDDFQVGTSLDVTKSNGNLTTSGAIQAGSFSSTGTTTSANLTVTGDLTANSNTLGTMSNPAKSNGWYKCANGTLLTGVQVDASNNVIGVQCNEL